MKKKRNIIILIIGILLVIGIIIGLFFIFNDKNKLTVSERNWIDNNINTVQNINVVNNANVFGKNGSGVYYSFLNDFSKEYNLKINPITFNSGDNPAGLSLGVKTSITDDDLVFYTDHFVLISKDTRIFNSLNNLNGITVGILTSDKQVVAPYLSGVNITYLEYATYDELLASFGDTTSYMIMPLMHELDKIIENNYNIAFHFSDINIYYTMTPDETNLSKVMVKYYNEWNKKFAKTFSEAEFKVVTSSLKLSETEVDSMQSITYNYGFMNNSPYEVIIGGKYGGIVGVYLSKFGEFADVDFNFVKYDNTSKFTKAIEKGDVDLYFNYYTLENDFTATQGIPVFYSAVARRDNNVVINSLNSLINKTVYVQKDSYIYDYLLNNYSGIKLVTYSDSKELEKLNNKDVIIVLDNNNFSYYRAKELNNYTERYSSSISNEYQFKVKGSQTLYRLLNAYLNITDYKEITIEGVNNHYETIMSGSIVSKIAEYFIYIFIAAVLITLIIMKRRKKITIAKRIKKDDKLKFIDQLTSLKNRNFLSENITEWNNNTIYPQTIVVMDLNKVQEINDIYGYEEGDKQIKAAANALIKTQLDNSEILRTDGNEFVMYLVGYSQKQVSNYIHKLNKELDNLPYEGGAEFGYSMILDDIKTIEDAMNEAVEVMKKQKSDGSEKQAKR